MGVPAPSPVRREGLFQRLDACAAADLSHGTDPARRPVARRGIGEEKSLALSAERGRAHLPLLVQLSEARLNLDRGGERPESPTSRSPLAWPRLRGFLEEDVAGARIIRALTIAADDSARDGETYADLFRGGRLQSTFEWRRSRAQADLTPIEQRFLERERCARTRRSTLAEQARTRGGTAADSGSSAFSRATY